MFEPSIHPSIRPPARPSIHHWRFGEHRPEQPHPLADAGQLCAAGFCGERHAAAAGIYLFLQLLGYHSIGLDYWSLWPKHVFCFLLEMGVVSLEFPGLGGLEASSFLFLVVLVMPGATISSLLLLVAMAFNLLAMASTEHSVLVAF